MKKLSNYDNMKGKTCIITGSNSGIGKATAIGIAKLGARVVMACRNPKRAEEARSQIIEETGNELIDLMIVDLSSQESIKKPEYL